MPPYAKSRTRIDADQMLIIESMIAEYSFLARDESDIDENDITFQPLTNDVNPTEINDIWNEHEHTLTMNSSPRRNRIRLQEHDQTVTTYVNTTPETIRNTQSIQDSNSSYDGCIFRKKRNQQKSKVVLRLFIYALIYCTAGFLEYLGIGTNPKRRISKTTWSQQFKD